VICVKVINQKHSRGEAEKDRENPQLCHSFNQNLNVLFPKHKPVNYHAPHNLRVLVEVKFLFSLILSTLYGLRLA
jgi:hypothetical protein